MAEPGINAPDLTVEFDAEEDVLYVNLGAPVACGHVDDRPDGLVLRRSSADALPNGVTAVGFRGTWFKRRPEFYSVVAGYLDLPADDIERATVAPVTRTDGRAKWI